MSGSLINGAVGELGSIEFSLNGRLCHLNTVELVFLAFITNHSEFTVAYLD